MSRDTVTYFDLTSDERVNDGLLWREDGRPFYEFTVAWTADELEAEPDGFLMHLVGPGVTAPAGCSVVSSDGFLFIGTVTNVVQLDDQHRQARIDLV